MKDFVHQGDVLKVEKIKHPVLVTSKDFFNRSGEIIGCPVFQKGTEGPLHIYIKTKDVEGYVQCEKLAMLDLTVRGYTEVSRLSTMDIMNISDAIQGIFDYI